MKIKIYKYDYIMIRKLKNYKIDWYLDVQH